MTPLLLRRRPSIYEHVRRHVRPGGGLAEGGETLPDEERSRETVAFAPGALEGAFVRYWGAPDVSEERVADLHQAVVALADRPGRASRRRFVQLARDTDVRTTVDKLLDRLAASPPSDLERLHAELVRMLVTGERRDEVKLAIALLGPFGHRPDAELFRTLAYHEEFTLYAAIALANVVDDRVGEWLALLPHLSGWGKTELTERLLRAPTAEVCAVLLRHGQSIGNALLLATECRLHVALAADELDDEVLEGARGIFDVLTGAFDSPDTLLDWPQAGQATVRLLELLAATERLDDFVLVGQIRDFLVPPEGDRAEGGAADGEPTHEEELRAAGFDDVRLARVLQLADGILSRPEWRERTEAAFASGDDSVRAEAIAAAKRLGIPLQEYLVEQIERHPHDGYLWYELVADADEDRIAEAIALAQRVLDLEAVGTGPALDLFGPPGGPHEPVEVILQELERFPGRGRAVLLPALRSPVTRQRLRAVRALGRWERETLPEQLIAALQDVVRRDPDDDVRRTAEDVLAGRPVD